MTLQETYEKIRSTILEQGALSHVPGGTLCMYRNPDGLKCAAGALIPDELYDKSIEALNNRTVGECLEGRSVSSVLGSRQLLHYVPELRELLNGSEERTAFIQQAQLIHDKTFTECLGPADFVKRLDNLARWKYRLQVPVTS